MGIFGIGKKSSKTYLCLKYPTLDMVIKPHPSKDRNGAVGEPGHHITFSKGKFSTSDQSEMEYIENHEYFNNGTITDEHIQQAQDIASKKAKLDKEAESIGYKLVKL